MATSLLHFFEGNREAIVREWVDRLITEVGEHYAARPRKELYGTVSEAYAANVHAIIDGNYHPINFFIDKITKMRLESGFPLSHVQKAFELFRCIVSSRLAGVMTMEEYSGATSKLNHCLGYTIHRFSDHFQAMHEKNVLENKVRETERMAYIGQITTSLSHEIRNPLSAVKMNLQILKKNPEIKGNDQRRIDIAVREVKRLEGILEELLDFAKPLQLKYGEHPLNSILTAALEPLEMKFSAEKMAVDTDLCPDLPKIRVDREKLVQAFINILLNALEASPPGSTIEISSRLATAGQEGVEVIIADEGYGVSEKNFPDIFKPFFTTKSKGTGLGLSNARQIIEAHGGRIAVENRDPAGAFFKVVLPLGVPGI